MQLGPCPNPWPVCVRVCVCVCVCARARVCVRTHTHIHYTQTHACTCVHILYIHIYIHTYIHTHIPSWHSLNIESRHEQILRTIYAHTHTGHIYTRTYRAGIPWIPNRVMSRDSIPSMKYSVSLSLHGFSPVYWLNSPLRPSVKTLQSLTTHWQHVRNTLASQSWPA